MQENIPFSVFLAFLALCFASDASYTLAMKQKHKDLRKTAAHITSHLHLTPANSNLLLEVNSFSLQVDFFKSFSPE